MDENKAEKGNKKVGADGLTKKERRALKTAATGKDVSRDINQPKTNSVEAAKTPSKEKVNKDKKVTEQKPQLVSKHASNKTSNQCPHGDSKTQPTFNEKTDQLVKINTVKELQAHAPVVNVTDAESIKGLSKAELKAQRRAIQEAQRLAKVNAKVEEVKKKPSVENKVVKSPHKEVSSKKESPKVIRSINKHKIPFFHHLCFESSEFNRKSVINLSGVHAAFLKLGEQYSSKTILGSNARCLALLSALKNLLLDFTTPPKQEFCRSLESTLQECVTYLNTCRPLAVSMTNTLRYFKLRLTQINTGLSDNEKRSQLIECINTYIDDEITKAGEAISMQVKGKISNNDIILTSSLITKILLDAHKEGKMFKVIVVDSRPILEGKEMLRKLVNAGMECTYVLISAASFVMNRVTKVLLGAHALLANGYVMSRIGTAQIALIANACKKPVLVCCETYKFSERVQTDSFVYNEIGNPNMLINMESPNICSLKNWQNSNYLTPLNLLYDVTPPDLVTAVVTELAFLPCTSVPVILRIRPTEIIT